MRSLSTWPSVDGVSPKFAAAFVNRVDFVPGVGPYDIWATAWGYKPIPGAKISDDEKPTLDQWARQQDSTPWLRFSTSGAAGSDPGGPGAGS